VPRGRDAAITITGVQAGDTSVENPDPSALLLRIGDGRTQQPLCEIVARLGQPAVLPSDCIARAALSTDSPGARLVVELIANARVAVGRIHVESAMVYVDGESLLNDVHDSGEDAIYSLGVLGCSDAHSAWLVLHPKDSGRRIRVYKRVGLSRPGSYDLWLRALTEKGPVHLRGRVTAFVDGREVGQSDCIEPNPPPESQCPYYPKWIRIGTFKAGREVEIALEAESGQTLPSFVDVDLIALEPLPTAASILEH
jgi:hypothetical protein